ncbi:MAG: extracellular solute-binding protein [Chloroflexi bacterium]|nr:extracellular solute-binding protein [Chloroflexota bacterium]
MPLVRFFSFGDRTNNKAGERRLLAWAGLLLMLGGWILAGCLAPTHPPPQSFTPTPTHPLQPTATPTPTPPQDLRVWVPAPLFPSEQRAAWTSLQGQARAFEATTGARVDLRRRGVYGPGGMLTVLVPARLAATATTPDVLLVPHDLLEALVTKAALPPLPEPLALRLRHRADWYPYARRAGHLVGVPYGLPIGGETVVLAWPQTSDAPPPATWAEWLRSPVPWSFPARDPYGWAYMAFYRAAGGTWHDRAGGRPTLDAEPWQRALEFLVQAQWQGTLVPEARAQTSFAMLPGPAAPPAQVTWSRYANLNPDWSWAPLPGPEDEAVPLARVYVWVVLTTDPQRRPLAIRWVEQVTRADWLAPWLGQLGLWPAQPGLSTSASTAGLDAYLSRAEAFPRMDHLFPWGHALSLAGQEVLEGRLTPLEAIPLTEQALGPPPEVEPQPEGTGTPSPAPPAPRGNEP